ncbi:hypothetical protein QR46_4715 [Giardia duodenalis assemblage B]|uniref:Uncharacterized protein n=1 Tax=Giardia duodenalis assemblage B TaxID=1394984 RepID=A0A132NMR7_GIAIN|nr:hypothetical protein QR46_4715 [Giardia intestinalis assemblage B]
MLRRLTLCSLATPVHTAHRWMAQPPRKEHGFSMALRRAESEEEDPLLPTSAVASGLSNRSWIGIFTASRVFSVHFPDHAVFDVSTFLYVSPVLLLSDLASITILLQQARPKIALHIPLCTESPAPGLGGANERCHHFDVHFCFDSCAWYHMSFCLLYIWLTVCGACGTLGIHILQSTSFLASTRIMPCNCVGGSNTH